MPAINTTSVRSDRHLESTRTSMSSNSLIAALPERDRHVFASSMELVRIAPATVVCHQGDSVRHVYFPIRGLMSLFGTTPDGEVLEVAAVGRFGIVGVPAVLEEEESPYRIVAHVSCDAYRMSASALREASQESKAARQTLLRAAHAQLVMIGDAALCHRFHTALQRLSRCLLAYSASSSSDTVALTQEVLADILGSPRTAISRAASQLQDCQAVRQRHGRLQILDRLRVARFACLCGRPDQRGRT